jgi:hypothetical protein
MAMPDEIISKVTLPNGEIVSARSYFSDSYVRNAVAGTDTTVERYPEGETPRNCWYSFAGSGADSAYEGLAHKALQAQAEMLAAHRDNFRSAAEALCADAKCVFDPNDAMGTLKNLLAHHAGR